MTHRSRMSPGSTGAGLLAVIVAVAPGLAGAAPVPSPTVPITPNTAGPAVPETAAGEVAPTPTPTPTPTPAETLPAPTTTPAPTPYAGPSAPVTPPPGATSPTPPAAPGAAPKPGEGFDMGGQSIAPLPPPPAALDPSTIRRQPWRGRWWLGLRLGIHGPVGGDTPARPTVLGFGGGADFGWRVGNVLGLGMGISGQAHNKLRLTVEDAYGTLTKQVFVGQMLYWDALFARIHLPLKKRFQPYLEVGGGLARLARAEGGRTFGAQVRGALGLEGWVTGNVTLGFAATYRLVALNDKHGDTAGWVVGHAMGGVFELAYHW
jgi:hypothetical protein